MSIYISLGIAGSMPRWLVILVVSRDILIVGGVMLAWFMGRPIAGAARQGVEAEYRGSDRFCVRRAGGTLGFGWELSLSCILAT